MGVRICDPKGAQIPSPHRPDVLIQSQRDLPRRRVCGQLVSGGASPDPGRGQPATGRTSPEAGDRQLVPGEATPVGGGSPPFAGKASRDAGLEAVAFGEASPALVCAPDHRA